MNAIAYAPPTPRATARVFVGRWWPLLLSINLPMALAWVLLGLVEPTSKVLAAIWIYGGILIIATAAVFSVLNLWGVVLGFAWMAGRRSDRLAGTAIMVVNAVAAVGGWFLIFEGWSLISPGC